MGRTVYKEGVEPTHNALWTVSLSNGETHYEGKGKFEQIPGELSPWRRLTDYIAQNKLSITSLGVYTRYGHRYNLPSGGNRPKMSHYNAPTPGEYNLFRALGRDYNAKNEDLYTVIEAIYENYSLQLWVDEHNPNNMWSQVVEKI